MESAEGKLEKMEVDYSTICDEKIPACEKIAEDGNLSEALNNLLVLEKQTRTGSDSASTGRILVAIIQLCFKKADWDKLNENIVLLSKRRGQLKQAVTKMVQEACSYVSQMPDKELRLKLLDTLRTVTDGKIYVEIERARLTMTLAKIREEEEGNVTEAANVLQELQVETFGSMEKREKVEFLLEQMRLCLAKSDFIRTQLISKKISLKYFQEKDTDELKLKFYHLMIQLDLNESKYLDICRHFRAVCDTKSVEEDEVKKTEAYTCAVLYLLLSPYDNEQSDLIHRISTEKSISDASNDLVVYKKLLHLFLGGEIVNWHDLCNDYEGSLKSGIAGQVFDESEGGKKRWEDFKIRVVEHNIRILSKNYTRVRLERMADILDLSQQEAEDFLSKLVVNKTVTAKIDRLSGIIYFNKTKDATAMLNDWSHNVMKLMQLVNKTTHHIAKEEMIHKIQ